MPIERTAVFCGNREMFDLRLKMPIGARQLSRSLGSHEAPFSFIKLKFNELNISGFAKRLFSDKKVLAEVHPDFSLVGHDIHLLEHTSQAGTSDISDGVSGFQITALYKAETDQKDHVDKLGMALLNKLSEQNDGKVSEVEISIVPLPNKLLAAYIFLLY